MLMRFDPFRELDRLTQDLGAWTRPAVMPMDAYHEGERLVARFDLPGVDPSSIDVTVERNVLTVTAERQWQQPDARHVIVSERPQGRFTRQMFLGEALDAEHLEASYDNGVLTVIVPVAERAKPRKIEVGVGSSSGSGQPEALEAASS